jgi:hypothetical protein
MDAASAACAGIEFGAPRVTALAELHQLLTDHGFRGSSRDDPMNILPAPAVPSPAPHQLSIAYDSAKLRGMTSAERRIALARLASLLLEAANVAAGERDDDKR